MYLRLTLTSPEVEKERDGAKVKTDEIRLEAEMRRGEAQDFQQRIIELNDNIKKMGDEKRRLRSTAERSAAEVSPLLSLALAAPLALRSAAETPQPLTPTSTLTHAIFS